MTPKITKGMLSKQNLPNGLLKEFQQFGDFLTLTKSNLSLARMKK